MDTGREDEDWSVVSSNSGVFARKSGRLENDCCAEDPGETGEPAGSIACAEAEEEFSIVWFSGDRF